MSKIKVLVVPSDRTGVGKFRSVDPHVKLNEMFGDDFVVDINYEPQLTDEFLTQYDIIHCHRTLGPYETAPALFNRLKTLGVKCILDLDDYWAPGIEHPAYQIIKTYGLAEKIVSNVKEVEYVSTTTTIFADKIKELNKNVFILPNAVDTKQKQFQSKTEDSDFIRIGWLGGSSHYHDLIQLDGIVGSLERDFDNLQYVICGFDIRGKVTYIDPQTRQQKEREIKPHETVWYQYENIFNTKTLVSPSYKDHMDLFINKPFEGEKSEKYRRVWTKPVTSYANNYNLFDISLAPLKPVMFNLMKSQLKVIEAGFHKKCLVAQDVAPYQLDVVNGKNGILVPYKKNSKPWYKALKRLIKEPNQIKDLGEALYETVKDTYSLEKVTTDRAELYRSLVKK
jgi:glycosyltransferase involved in cell wall biosynthesis